MSTESPGRRRRTYVFPGRQKRLSIRVTDGEDAEIANAANQLGLTPTGFCAHAALDAARHLHTGTTERMEHEALANIQAELSQARVTLNQLRADLNLARKDNRSSPQDLDTTVARTVHAVADVDSAITVSTTGSHSASQPPRRNRHRPGGRNRIERAAHCAI